MNDNNSKPESVKTKSSGGFIVLQWLSYAFWGWLGVSLIWLTALVLAFFIDDSQSRSAIAYALATNIVLLPVAFMTDLFHRKHELSEKAGFASVVMIIHSVLFALIAIGTLIGAVFVGISMLVDAQRDLSTQVVVLLTLVISSLVFAGLFLRVLNPSKTKQLPRLFAFSMLVLVLAFLVLSVVGPVARSISARSDIAIENGLSSVAQAISLYTKDNGKLPTNLGDVDYSSSEAKELINRDVVRYQQDQAPVSINTSSARSSTKRLYYQLCVTYKYESDDSNNTYDGGYDNEVSSSLGYKSSVYTYSHPKGDVCYKLVVTDYNASRY